MVVSVKIKIEIGNVIIGTFIDNTVTWCCVYPLFSINSEEHSYFSIIYKVWEVVALLVEGHAMD